MVSCGRVSVHHILALLYLYLKVDLATLLLWFKILLEYDLLPLTTQIIYT